MLKLTATSAYRLPATIPCATTSRSIGVPSLAGCAGAHATHGAGVLTRCNRNQHDVFHADAGMVFRCEGNVAQHPLVIPEIVEAALDRLGLEALLRLDCGLEAIEEVIIGRGGDVDLEALRFRILREFLRKRD